jgi:hypothetical protein
MAGALTLVIPYCEKYQRAVFSLTSACNASYCHIKMAEEEEEEEEEAEKAEEN